jgi:hypothetical protein
MLQAAQEWDADSALVGLTALADLDTTGHIARTLLPVLHQAR